MIAHHAISLSEGCNKKQHLKLKNFETVCNLEQKECEKA